MRQSVSFIFILIYSVATLGLPLQYHTCLMRDFQEVQVYTGGDASSCCAVPRPTADGLAQTPCCHILVEQPSISDQVLSPIFTLGVQPESSLQCVTWESLTYADLAIPYPTLIFPGFSPPLII
ncbi:MAG: hypothetical protein D6675_00115 [Gemmatimonadetes bacterium]|nr:MAG: hypothetical protein D6675_00115 [Gemmatimonadota bacterium]